MFLDRCSKEVPSGRTRGSFGRVHRETKHSRRDLLRALQTLVPHSRSPCLQFVGEPHQVGFGDDGRNVVVKPSDDPLQIPPSVLVCL